MFLRLHLYLTGNQMLGKEWCLNWMGLIFLEIAFLSPLTRTISRQLVKARYIRKKKLTNTALRVEFRPSTGLDPLSCSTGAGFGRKLHLCCLRSLDKQHPCPSKPRYTRCLLMSITTTDWALAPLGPHVILTALSPLLCRTCTAVCWTLTRSLSQEDIYTSSPPLLKLEGLLVKDHHLP